MLSKFLRSDFIASFLLFVVLNIFINIHKGEHFLDTPWKIKEE